MGRLQKEFRGRLVWNSTYSRQFQDEPTAEPVSDTGSTSMITFFKKCNNHCTAAVRKKSEKNMGKTALWTPRPAVKEGEEMLQMLEQRFFCRTRRRTQWRRLSPCIPGMTPVEQVSTCSP